MFASRPGTPFEVRGRLNTHLAVYRLCAFWINISFDSRHPETLYSGGEGSQAGRAEIPSTASRQALRFEQNAPFRACPDEGRDDMYSFEKYPLSLREEERCAQWKYSA
jgi:hypothetical protein